MNQDRRTRSAAGPVQPEELAADLARQRRLEDARRADELARERAQAAHVRARADVAQQARLAELVRAEREDDARAEAELARLYRRFRAAGERTRIKSQLARSGEARAVSLERLRVGNLRVLVPLLVGFGLWSTTGVQAGAARLMNVHSGDPVWWVLWGLEALLIGTVCWIIVVRARLAAAGGSLSASAERIGAGCLATSIGLNLVAAVPAGAAPAGWAVPGAMFAHAIGPVGAALVAHLIGTIDRSISAADPWHDEYGAPAPRLAELDLRPPAAHGRPSPTPEEQALPSDHAGGTRRVAPGRSRHLDLGADAPAQADDPDAGPEVDPEAWVQEQGRVTAEQVAAFLSEQGPPEQGAASFPPAPHDEGPAGAALHAPSTEPAIRPDRADDGAGRGSADRPGAERVLPAAQARRAAGASTRHRIAQYVQEHPDASVEQIAAALRLGVTTVKRHRRALREQGWQDSRGGER